TRRSTRKNFLQQLLGFSVWHSFVDDTPGMFKLEHPALELVGNLSVWILGIRRGGIDYSCKAQQPLQPRTMLLQFLTRRLALQYLPPLPVQKLLAQSGPLMHSLPREVFHWQRFSPLF